MAFKVKTFVHAESATFSYVVYAGEGTACAIIDPVLDFNPNNFHSGTDSADEIAAFVEQCHLKCEWLLETHIHADHLSAAQYLKQKLSNTAKIAASKAITFPCATFRKLFNFDSQENLLSYFDHLFEDEETFNIGSLKAKALWAPGHTPADVVYQIENHHVFVGDTIFAPDVGTARCDFPGGSAERLFHSIQRILALPPEACLYLCHDYPEGRRELQNIFSVAEQRNNNIHVKAGTDSTSFVAMRRARDATLALPDLMIPAIQVNIRAGQFPKAERNGISYLKMPINTF